jgi:FtsP/CotA-like multicopper oxidase with cupredoxin domain
VFVCYALLLHTAVLLSVAMLSLLTICLSLAAVAFAGQCHFKLELTWGTGSPDGYTRDMIFVNGEYPGPLLEIQQGDWVEIEVLNSMPFNSSIHYHGKSSTIPI